MIKFFKCENCGFLVKTGTNIGTKNRNHCPKCLFSKHVDEKKPGDRNSKCMGLMKPIDTAFKKPKTKKYAKEIVGELMIVHKCKRCFKISKNRIASDDNEEEILKICKNDNFLDEIKKQLYGKS